MIKTKSKFDFQLKTPSFLESFFFFQKHGFKNFLVFIQCLYKIVSEKLHFKG